jgi:hypothetical protein
MTRRATAQEQCGATDQTTPHVILTEMWPKYGKRY